MEIIADESCDHVIVRALRDRGVDIVSVSELAPGSSDRAVLTLAASMRRALLTEDKDFGELVFLRREYALGVILVRGFSPALRASAVDAISRLCALHSAGLDSKFVVVQPGHIRINSP